MSKETLNPIFRFNSGHLTYAGEVTEENALELRNMSREMADDYFYKRIEIEIINNQGGMVSAMQMIARKLNGLQSSGVIVATHGIGTVASAAAVILSSGSLKERTVSSTARLIYHLGRMQNVTNITSNRAQIIGKKLEQIDEEIITSLINHIIPLARESRSADNTWLWPLQPINDLPFARLLLKPKRSITLQACTKHMFKTLIDVFSVDAVMEPKTALALGLIDGIYD